MLCELEPETFFFDCLVVRRRGRVDLGGGSSCLGSRGYKDEIGDEKDMGLADVSAVDAREPCIISGYPDRELEAIELCRLIFGGDVGVEENNPFGPLVRVEATGFGIVNVSPPFFPSLASPLVLSLWPATL